MHLFFRTVISAGNPYLVWFKQLTIVEPEIVPHHQTKSWALPIRCVKNLYL